MRSFSIVRRNLAAHPLRSILTILAIALGVAMLFAASIVGLAASHSASSLESESPHIDLEVFARDSKPFDISRIDILTSSPDVEQVSPTLNLEVEVISPQIDNLRILGVEENSYRVIHPLVLLNGVFLGAPNTIVLLAQTGLGYDLIPGDEIILSLGEGPITFTVSGCIEPEQDVAAAAPGGVTAFIPLDAAQKLANLPGKLDHIEITLRSGIDIMEAKDRLAGLLGADLVVVRSEFRGDYAFNTVLIQGGLVVVGLIILFAAGFVIMNAFAMSVTARVHEIGALRALGMTRRQVFRSMLAEAGTLGTIGSAGGILLGLGLAWGVMKAMGSLEDVPFEVPWWGVLLSVLAGMIATVLGALNPMRRASHIAPIEAIRIGIQERSSWYLRSGGRVGSIILLVLLPGLAAYGLIGRPDIWSAMAATGVGIVGLLFSMTLLLSAIVRTSSKLFRHLLFSWFGIPGQLAADNVSRNQVRSALTAGAMAIGLTMIIATSGLLPLFLEGSIGLIGELSNEQIMIARDFVGMMSSGEMNLANIYQTMADITIDPAIGDELAPLVEADVIELERVGIAPVPPELATVPTGITAGMFVDSDIFIRIGNFDFYEGDPETALEWMRRGRAVLLQPLAAERLGVGVGDTIMLETSQGEVEFTVAGVGGSSVFSPIFPYADGEEYFGLAGLFQLNVIVPEDGDVTGILDQVQRLIEPFPGVVVMESVGAVIDEASNMFGQFQALLDGLLLVAVVIAAFGVVNTMTLNITERIREIALLRVVGSTRRQVRQMIVIEAVTLGVTAALTAICLSVLMVLVYALLVMPNGWGALGIRVDWEITRSSLLSAFGDMVVAGLFSVFISPLVAGCAAYFLAKRAADLEIAPAIRGEYLSLKTVKTRRPRGNSHAGS
ncbi:MAG: ABC transporter permease [Anaerolineaceae bacterium]|nr:ABC transporter permease [Anaerolineaceae bacterium]